MIPAATDQRWHQILTGRRPFNPTMLSSQMLMQRLLTRVKGDSSPAAIAAAAAELRAFYEKYEKIAQNDLRQIGA